MKCFVILVSLLMGFSSETSSTDSALYLTSYIKRNETSKARILSAVDPNKFLNIHSHSGFLTVDEKYNSNLFFWYFPARPPNNKTDIPWILWLQGGPGATSMFGLFSEMGPLQWKNDHLEARKYAWSKQCSMLFIDNPVGAGFSFTNHKNGTPNNLNETAQHLLSALEQFLQVFPEQRTAPFYIAGESFAGRYAPALAQKIMESKLKINMTGLILGNPIINHIDIANFTSLFYFWSMIDDQGAKEAKPYQDAYYQALKSNDSITADDAHNQLLDELESIADHHNDYNALVDVKPDRSFEDFITRPEIQDALHVGRIKFTFSNQTKLRVEFLTDMTPTVETLLNHYRILIYCGQLDLVTWCAGAAGARRGWAWARAGDFRAAARRPWWRGNTLAGYSKSGGGLTEVLVRNAGHIVPSDRPAEAFQMISSFLHYRPLPTAPYDIADDVTTPAPSTTTTTTTNKPVIVTQSSIGAGVITSITLNVVLVAAIMIIVLQYWRKKRRAEDFYYTEDSLSDGILTMS